MTKINGKIAAVICAVFLAVLYLAVFEGNITTVWITSQNVSDWTKNDFAGISREIDLPASSGLNASLLSSTKPEYAEKRFRFRAERLRTVCEIQEQRGVWTKEESAKYHESWISNDNFLVVPNRSFLVCVLPKCSSSSWHWIARDLRDPLSEGHEFGWQDRQKNIELNQELNPVIGKRLLEEENGFRAITVRHPFGKMISGWNNKLDRENPYNLFMLEAYPIMKTYTSNKDERHVMAFEDLADYLAKYGDDFDKVDYHFRPMESLCLPCFYPYNYVVKLETLPLDLEWIKQSLNITKMPWQKKGITYFSKDDNKPSAIIRGYFKKVKKSTILKLMKLYYYDFALFGYSFDVDTLTAGGFV